MELDRSLRTWCTCEKTLWWTVTEAPSAALISTPASPSASLVTVRPQSRRRWPAPRLSGPRFASASVVSPGQAPMIVRSSTAGSSRSCSPFESTTIAPVTPSPRTSAGERVGVSTVAPSPCPVALTYSTGVAPASRIQRCPQANVTTLRLSAQPLEQAQVGDRIRDLAVRQARITHAGVGALAPLGTPASAR